MAKFTVETKVRAAQDYLTGLDSQKGIARCYVMSRQVLQQWIDFYQHHGEYGLWKRYTNYTAEFKIDVLNFMNETGASPYEAPVSLLVIKWFFRIFGEASFREL